MTPQKRGLTVLTILLLFAPLAFATHSATLTTNYVPIYETNPVNVTLTVDNGLFSAASINNVNVQTNGFSINNIANILGWTTTNNNSINFFTNTNAISNWGTQRFGFDILANNVNQDTTYDWTITTTDTSSDSQSQNIQFQVLNDNTPPVITSTTPGNFILGTNSELFSVNANDPETAINGANLHISNCDLIFDNSTNTSNIVYATVPLSCSNNICSINKDLSAENEGDVCFYYDVSNKGGETATTNNLTTIIDRTPPNVTLTSPNDNIFINATSVDLGFDASDNFATQLNCNVVVNGNSNPVTTSQISNTFNIPVTDGLYTWSVNCKDGVNLTGNSATRTFNVDNSAPNITISVPAVNDRGNNVVIDTTINDIGSGVNQNSIAAQITDTNGNVTTAQIVNNQIILPTTTSTIPGTYTVTISASDNLGQSTSISANFRIRETYKVTVALNQTKTDSSTANNSIFLALTGNVIRDDGIIPIGTVDVTEIMTNEMLNIDNLTGNFNSQMQIPQANGGYTIIATYTNGADVFSGNTNLAVGPYCGNGILDAGEQCDGSTSDICSNYGYSQGTVSCTAQCTIDTTQCSNPPQQSSSSGGSGGNKKTSGGSNVLFVTQPEPLLGNGGVIETPQTVQQPAPSSGGIIETQNTTIEPTVEQPSNIGIGASWAAFVDFSKGLNKTILLIVALIAILLYVFGWREKEDEWDRYFRKYGQH